MSEEARDGAGVQTEVEGQTGAGLQSGTGAGVQTGAGGQTGNGAGLQSGTVAGLQTGVETEDGELTSEETDSRKTSEQAGRQSEGQTDGPTVCPPAAESSSVESKWAVGAECLAVWSEDGQEYPAKLVSMNGERCRVCFNGYGNVEDVELSTLRSPDAAQQTQKEKTQDWKPGSRCRAVYSEDGLVYPAVVLWVKGQHCRVRFDDYNNEEEQDVSCLLSPGDLHGLNRATAPKDSSWRSSGTSTNLDWKKMKEESQGEKGGRRGEGGERGSAWRDYQRSSSWVKDKLCDQSQVHKDTEERKKVNQQRDEAHRLTNHSFSCFPPFPPPPSQSDSGDSMSFIPPPPPPPFWAFGGNESGSSPGVSATSNMLMLWYTCGFYTGSYMAQQMFRSSSKD